MSKQNTEIAKHFFETAGKGDMNTARTLLDNSVEWIEPTVGDMFFSGTHRGANAVYNEVLAPTFNYIEDFSLKIDRYIEAGEDEVVVLGSFKGRGKSTGKELNAPFCMICKIKNGKIAHFQNHTNTSMWLDVLGVQKAKAA